MGFLSLFTKSTKTNGNHSATHALIDGDSLVDERSKSAKSRPGDQVTALKWLSELSNKEGLKMAAVFGGSRLREVAEDDDYKGIHVQFSKDGSERHDILLRLVKTHGVGQSVVVTADEKLRERVLSMGAASMRPSTLKKAGEASLGRPIKKRRSSRNSRPSRSRRPQRKEKPAQNTSREDKEILEYIDPL